MKLKVVECEQCGGRGKAPLFQLSDYFDPCPSCKGTGHIFIEAVNDSKRSFLKRFFSLDEKKA